MLFFICKTLLLNISSGLSVISLFHYSALKCPFMINNVLYQYYVHLLFI